MLFTIQTQAQFTVSGIVKDAETNERLQGASVLISSMAMPTNAEGGFTFNAVRPGKYLLQVTFIGFEKYEQQLVVDKDVKLEISLAPDLYMADEVIVSATRASENTPTTYSSLDKETIRENNLGQDLPFVLNWTPSLVTTSDAGAGVGYTGLRIRGSDATRINVTINGIPLNDSESQSVYWVDIPDIASSTENIQIQRGVGTSTNGAGAFGGTINLQTNSKKKEAYGEIINTYGSYDTWRHTLGFGTGLIKDHWSFDGRLSRITSDGYIDRASSELSSYYLAGGYYAKNTLVKAIIFGGKERTYQSWYGTPEAVLNGDAEGIEAVIANNGLNEAQAENMRTAGRTFNWYLYEDQVDDYQQDHYQLHVSQRINDDLLGNVSLHYTKGQGYYEQYRYDDDFEDYNLPNVVIANETIESSDLIRRRWLDNDYYGFTYSFDYNKQDWDIVLGGAYSRYEGGHFGRVIWAEFAPNIPKGTEYYNNDGDKSDFNTFIKANYQVSSKLNVFGDLQYRNINYSVSGVDNDLRSLNVEASYNFFNPKFGAVFAINDLSNLYASYSVANREPVRTDFIDSPVTPKHETLYNVEAGYRKRGQNYQVQINQYLMAYKNQLVLTGELNDVGSPLRTNVEASYRLGLELEGQVQLTQWLRWMANAAFSQNKIGEFNEVIYDYGPAFDEFNIIENEYSNTDIAFSPNVIIGSQLTFIPAEGLELSLLSKYVGKQYLDNTSSEDRALSSYLINDARLSYVVKTKLVHNIALTLQVNNLANVEYASNGYTFGYQGGSDYVVRENYLYPQATRNFLASIALKF